MRTLVVHWGRTAAGPRFACDLAWTLAEQGADVSLQLNSDADIAAAASQGPVPVDWVRTYRSSLGVVLNAWRIVVNGIELRRVIRSRGITTVISAMPSIYEALSLPLFIGRLARFVPIIHDGADHPGEQHPLKTLGRRLELRRADGVLALSGHVADTLRSRGVRAALPICVAFHPVPPPSAELAGARCRRVQVNGVRRVGFFGRLVAYKGLDIFLEAARQLRARRTDIEFVVVGSGPDETLSQTEAGAAAQWRIGYVPDGALPEALADLDLLALPYREASQSGVVALALGQGLPSVVTPVGGLIEQVEQSGCGAVAPTLSADALATCIEELADDAARWTRYAEAGSRAAQRWSWQQFATRVLRFIACLEYQPVPTRRPVNDGDG